MYCAACGELTETEPCSVCGASPLLDGRYRIDGILGHGSQATTWRATRIADGEVVAIKEIVLGARPDQKALDLFQREARVLRELYHPAIPRYFEEFQTSLGRQRALCLVRELVVGVTLAEEALERRYTVDEVAGIVEELAKVVAWLHGLSPPVIHRDIKPENIVRRPDGSLTLIDFGSVRDVIKGTLGGTTVAGTFGYMPPEQFAGDAQPESDVYALGALAVELLTRKDPKKLLDGSGRLAWRRHAAVSDETADFIDRMLDWEPAARPEADELFFPGTTFAPKPPPPEPEIAEPIVVAPPGEPYGEWAIPIWIVLFVVPAIATAVVMTNLLWNRPTTEVVTRNVPAASTTHVESEGLDLVLVDQHGRRWSTPCNAPAGVYGISHVGRDGYRTEGGSVVLYGGGTATLHCDALGANGCDAMGNATMIR